METNVSYHLHSEAEETGSKNDIVFVLILVTDTSKFFISLELSSLLLLQLLPCNSSTRVHSTERHMKIIKAKLF